MISIRSATLRRLALAVAMFCLGANVAQATPLDGGDRRSNILRARDEPLDSLIQNAEHAPPITLVLLAKRLYDVDRRDEAVFWFYVGQLRWRACLIQSRNCDGQTFSRLFETVGPDINQYAFRTIPAFSSMVESVLAWDASHHDDYVTDTAAKEQAREGLRDLITYTQEHAAELTARQEELAREEAARGGDRYASSGGALFGTPPELLHAYDARRFAAFRRGATTRADVLSELGRPEYWSTSDNGTSSFSYSFLRNTEVTAILGMSQIVQVTIHFDREHIVSRVTLPSDRQQ